MWLRWAASAALMLSVAAFPATAADSTAAWRAYTAGDHERAERLWRPEAERGDANAAFGLGVIAESRGDDAEATRWYEQAAQRGLPAAQVLIGQRYAEGTGVARDPVLAYAWFTRAIEAGVPNAAKVRDALAATMTPEAIEEAEAAAARLGM
ncbi:MAG: tetratricopeptide repeat protein [Alphaproteobacteria bacterium]